MTRVPFPDLQVLIGFCFLVSVFVSLFFLYGIPCCTQAPLSLAACRISNSV